MSQVSSLQAGAARAQAARAAKPARPFEAVLRAALPRARPRGRLDAASPPSPRERALAARLAAPEERCARALAAPREAAELRAVVRALPVAIAALGARAGDGVALDLGRTLSVELRSVPAGLEVVLRPAPEVARVAAAELPALVKALRERGVRVARAEVRPRR